ncbi:eukaryotic translation initiation factor 3 subunit M [Cyclospora cayetanensis]|uniref:Eukaryotic translation initiation factor 3 subunit M n=2 Tax=Cyclospora cayetanensis TaxID=88456 RepID=A0A6P5WD95_9EIME|nr:eukaryotic translation initiation factor 3 subunit M [Cyclospora cayetanensis]OEH77091.1 pci domain-containing protein [Cyclospora cayetanensis]
MSTFVPLAADTDGTATAVAVGEWLLHIISLYDSEENQTTNGYYRQFMECFSRDEAAGETRICDPMQLLNLLLSQNELVFRWLIDVKNAQEQHGSGPPATGSDGKPEAKKSYMEALREVEDFFVLLISIVVLRIEDCEKAGQAAGSFCSAFRASKELPEFRVKLMMCLYNAFPPTFPYRFPIFVSLLEFAAETNLFHMLLPYVKYINEWAKDWNLGPAAHRQVFLILANELKKLGKTDEAFDYLKRHVHFFQGEPEEVLAEGATVSAAVELAEDAIRMPDILYFDSLLELSAVKMLQKTQHAPLYRLLELFCRGGPKELEELHAQQPQLLETYGLKYETCLKKLRLLSVASVVANKKNIGFKQLSDALRLSENQAEEVVVQAIGLGLIDAKVDQINRVVHIRTAIQREFGREQWEEVAAKLDHWHLGVTALLQSIETAKLNAAETSPSPVSAFQ